MAIRIVNKITILIVDDQPPVRSGIRTMLEKISDCFVVGEAVTLAHSAATAGWTFWLSRYLDEETIRQKACQAIDMGRHSVNPRHLSSGNIL